MIQKKRRIRRCSFCSRTDEQVANLIYKSNVSICDDCVDTCQAIVVTGGEKLRLLKWSEWSRDILTRQYQILSGSAMRLMGQKEMDVIDNFGRPDRVSGPDKIRYISGKVKYKIDKRLIYSSLSSQVKFIFEILRGEVREVIIVPVSRTKN